MQSFLTMLLVLVLAPLLLQVRDARAPLTSCGCLEAIKPPKHLKRLIVLNKCDLVSSTDAKVGLK